MSEDTRERGTVGDGVALALGNALASVLAFALLGVMVGVGVFGVNNIYMAFLPVLGFGVAQIPGVIYFAFKNRDQPRKMKGLIIASSILFLLNAGCWGFFVHVTGRLRLS